LFTIIGEKNIATWQLAGFGLKDKKTGKEYNSVPNLRNYFNLIKRIISKSAPCH